MDDMRGNKNIYEDDIIRRESRDNYKPRQKMENVKRTLRNDKLYKKPFIEVN